MLDKDRNWKLFVFDSERAQQYIDLRDIYFSQVLLGREPGPKNVAEVGVLFGGWSAHVMMNVDIESLVGIDPYPGDEGPLIKAEMFQNMERLGFTSRFKLISGWHDLPIDRVGDRFDLIHVDGEHSEKATLNDLHQGAARLKPNGVLVCDDWHHPMFPGVGSALHLFMGESEFRMFAITDRKAYLCHQDFHADWQAFSTAKLSDDSLVEWWWQHAQIPEERLASLPDRDSTDQPERKLGTVADYKIANEVRGFPTILILGENSLSGETFG